MSRSAHHEMQRVINGDMQLPVRRRGRRGLAAEVRELLVPGSGSQSDDGRVSTVDHVNRASSSSAQWYSNDAVVKEYLELAKPREDAAANAPECTSLTSESSSEESIQAVGESVQNSPAAVRIPPKCFKESTNFFHKCFPTREFVKGSWKHACFLPSSGANHPRHIAALSDPRSEDGGNVLSGNLKKHLMVHHSSELASLGKRSWYDLINDAHSGAHPGRQNEVLAMVLAAQKAGAERWTKEQSTPTGMERFLIRLTPKNSSSAAAELDHLKQLSWMAMTSTPFNLADNVVFRDWAIGSAYRLTSTLPHRDSLRTKYLECLYACVLRCELERLHTADAFAVTFDAWSSRRKRKAMVAVTYHYLDEELVPVETVLDVIPTFESHTGVNLAVRIAKRVEARTRDNQVLYTATTDNASNVKMAARLIVDRFHELQALDVADEDGLTSEQEATLEFDDDCEPERAVGCFAHAVNLAVSAMYRVQAVSRIVKKVTDIVAAFGRSTLRQQALTKIQGQRKSPRLTLISYSETRWNSLKACLERFVKVYDDVLCAYGTGVFDRSYVAAREEEELPMVTRMELFQLNLIIQLLDPVEQYSVFLQGARYFTLAHSLYFYEMMVEAIDKVDASELVGFAAAKDTLLTQLEDRFAPFMEPGPTLLAALVHPAHFGRTSEGIDDEARAVCLNMLADWYQVLHDDEADTVASVGSKRKAVFGMPDGGPNESTPLESRAKALNEAKRLMFAVQEESERYDQHGGEGLTVGQLDEIDEKARAFFNKLDPDKKALCRMVLTGVPSSAASERAFSSSGLVDAPLRARLSATSLEMLTVVQCFFKKHGRDPSFLDKFWNDVQQWIGDPEDSRPHLNNLLSVLKEQL